MTTDIKRITVLGQTFFLVRKIEGREIVGVVGSYLTKAEAEAAQAAAA